ncbi:MAG: DNA recombination/repair protein RecA, partial [Methylophaga nitratireducenticrescens]
EKSGAWYSYDGNRIGQGKDNVRIYLKEHPEMAKDIEAKIRAVMMPKNIKANAETPVDDEIDA